MASPAITIYYRFVQLNRYWSTPITHAWLEAYKPLYTDSYKNKPFENSLAKLPLGWGWRILPAFSNNYIYGSSPSCHHLINGQRKRKFFLRRNHSETLFRWMNGQICKLSKFWKHHPLVAIVRNNFLAFSLDECLLNFLIRMFIIFFCLFWRQSDLPKSALVCNEMSHAISNHACPLNWFFK